LEEIFRKVQDEWGLGGINIVVGVTDSDSDVSGEARKARRDFVTKYPRNIQVVLDCYAHQVCTVHLFTTSIVVYFPAYGLRDSRMTELSR
jgi:hypothetical protein